VCCEKKGLDYGHCVYRGDHLPEGAVKERAILVLTTPKVLQSNDPGPFSGYRMTGVAFDIFLVTGDDRTIQSRKALEVVLPQTSSSIIHQVLPARVCRNLACN
jgi:hypothetical protein